MAIEIKRTVAGQSFLNRPVGVVRTASGTDKIYAQKAQQFSQLGAFAFDLAKEAQITEGREYANLTRVRNEAGEVEYKELPFSLGRYGQAAANEILTRKYITALKQDQVDAAKQIRELSGNDSVAFETNFDAWIEKRAKLIEQSGGSEILSGFIESASIYKKEMVNDIVTKNLELEKRQSQALWESVSRQEISDMGAAYRAGQFEDAKKSYDAIYTTTNSSFVTGVINKDKQNETLTALNRARLEGIVLNRFQNQPPEVIKMLELELRGGESGQNILEKNPDILKAFNSLPDATQATFLGSLSKLATKQTEFNKSILQDLEDKRSLSYGFSTKDQMNRLLSQTPFDDSGEPIGTGLQILRSPGASIAAVDYMKRGGSLEPEFKSAVSQVLNGRSYDPDAGIGTDLRIINTALAALETDRSVNGKPVLRTDMGLTASEVGRLTYLRDAIKLGPSSFERAMNVFSNPQAAADMVNARLDEEFRGKDIFESADKVLADQSGLKKIPDEIKRENKSYFIDLLMTQESVGDAITKFEEHINVTYVESSYMEGVSQYTPEVRFPELTQEKDHRGNFFTFALESFKGNRNVTPLYSASYEAIGVNTPFNDHIDKVLSLTNSKDLTYKDVTLVTNNALTDNDRTVYYILDKKTRNYVTDGKGQPATIDSNRFKNLIKVQSAKDNEYASRYTGGTDELESFMRSFVGLAGVPVTTAQEILRNTIGALPSKFGLPQFDVPAYGSSAQMKSSVTKFFNPESE